jgi:DNA topoisomerase-1
MAKNLLIVESPAKAKTIGGYLGSDFVVKSSYGHIRDLAKGNNAVKVDQGYAPEYLVPDDKKAVVSELKKLAKSSDLVWLASDEDREGEAIAWHLQEVLGLPDTKVRRIVFHEITKPAITNAVANPRKIDVDLVMAQQARRILDRLVGFELSPLLWRKVKPGLSAGRVQSVAVRLLVEREREIHAFNAQAAFRVNGWFQAEKSTFKTELNRRFEKEEEVSLWLSKAMPLAWTVSAIEKKPLTKGPAAPFTTSTLQQEASRKLRFGVKKTMRVAQTLYEGGFITYMRTDSVNLSQTALAESRDAILEAYGPTYHQQRQFKTKSASAQEAHEAIRPTDFKRPQVSDLEKDQQALYELIWKRAVASQMADAKIEKTKITVGAKELPEDFGAEGEVVLFDGFLKLYLEGNDDEDNDKNEDQQANGLRLPVLVQGASTPVERMLATQRYTRPPSRYTEASLVKKLEELGIGRPSTYAPTISTVQDRGYVESTQLEGNVRDYIVLEMEKGQPQQRQVMQETTGADKGKLRPTDIGMIVTDFLLAKFPVVMDYGFTAGVEGNFDQIAEGNLVWTRMLDEFYGPFHKAVLDGTESDRVNGSRVLGQVGDLEYSVRMARYGVVACRVSMSDPEAKPQYAKLKPGMSMEQLDLDQALDLFKLPRQLTPYQEKSVKVASGRFGPYVQWGDLFVSIPKEYDPLSLTDEEAVFLIQAKERALAERLIQDFPDSGIQILKGRFGPYLTRNGENYRIPKGADVVTADEAQCVQWIEQSPPPKPKRGAAGKAQAKKSPVTPSKAKAKKARG